MRPGRCSRTSNSAPAFISAVAGGLKLVAISANRVDTPDHPTNGIVVAKGSGIKSILDLQNKTVATPGPVTSMSITTVNEIKDQGGDPSTVKFVTTPNAQIPALIKGGRVDACNCLEPFRTQLVKEGYKDIGNPFRVISDDVAAAFYISTSDFAANNPEIVKKWRASMQEADDFIKNNPEKAKSILVETAHVPEDVAQESPLSLYATKIPAGTVKGWIDAMTEAGVLKKKLNAQDLLAQ